MQRPSLAVLQRPAMCASMPALKKQIECSCGVQQTTGAQHGAADVLQLLLLLGER